MGKIKLKFFLMLVLAFAGTAFFSACMMALCPYCQKPMIYGGGVYHKKCQEKHLAKLEAERIAREKAALEYAKMRIAREKAALEASKKAEKERIAREKAAAEAAKKSAKKPIARGKATPEAAKKSAKKPIARGKATPEAAKKAKEERIAREKAAAEAAKKRVFREAAFGILLKVRENIADIHQVFGKESNADLEEFGNNHLPKMTALYLELQQKAEEAKQNLDEIVQELKSSGVELEEDETYQALFNNYENCLEKYWVLRTRIVDLYLAHRVEAISADELLKTDNIEPEIYKKEM